MEILRNYHQKNQIGKSIVPVWTQKYYGEVMCKMFSEVYGLEISLRYFNIYGERQNVYKMVIGIFVDQLLNGKPMTIRGDGEQRRDFTYVGDVVLKYLHISI